MTIGYGHSQITADRDTVEHVRKKLDETVRKAESMRTFEYGRHFPEFDEEELEFLQERFPERPETSGIICMIEGIRAFDVSVVRRCLMAIEEDLRHSA